MLWSVLQSASHTTTGSPTSVAVAYGTSLSSGTKLIAFCCVNQYGTPTAVRLGRILGCRRPAPVAVHHAEADDPGPSRNRQDPYLVQRGQPGAARPVRAFHLHHQGAVHPVGRRNPVDRATGRREGCGLLVRGYPQLSPQYVGIPVKAETLAALWGASLVGRALRRGVPCIGDGLQHPVRQPLFLACGKYITGVGMFRASGDLAAMKVRTGRPRCRFPLDPVRPKQPGH
jgi:hypothetical protein